MENTVVIQKGMVVRGKSGGNIWVVSSVSDGEVHCTRLKISTLEPMKRDARLWAIGVFAGYLADGQLSVLNGVVR